MGAGYTRWNTDLECLEVFDGDAWICLNEDAPLPVSLGSLFVAAGTTAELPKETSLVYDSITVENTGTLISNNAYSEIRVLGNVNISGTLEIRPVIKGGDSPGNGSRTGPSALSLVLEGRPGLGLGVGNSDNQGVVYGPELQPYGSSGGSSRVAFDAQGGTANAIGWDEWNSGFWFGKLSINRGFRRKWWIFGGDSKCFSNDHCWWNYFS